MKRKPVAFLLSLHFAAPALAIGLGDLSVHSSLGQPLHATVEVLSAPPTLAADCLSLHPSDNDLPVPAQARFRVERRGDSALLHITTPRAIDDPVAQFVLASDCEGRLEREYVLLLDPPAQIESAELALPQTAPPSAAAEMPPVAASAPAGPAATSVSAKPRTSRPLPRRTAPSKPATPTVLSAPVARPAAAALRASLTQLERAAAKPKTTSAIPTATPRLVISGKRDVSQSGSLPAGLEKDRAPPDQSSSRAASLTSAELSDENTALNHRLAYLETQIAALHKRNAELEAQRAAPSLATTIPQPTTTQASSWPLYLIGFGLFTLSGVLFAGMRRRRDLPRSESAATLPMARPVNVMPVKAHVSPPPLPDAMPENDSPQPIAPPPTPEDQDSVNLPLSALAKRTVVKEDILNQAEVFIAHGYINMAINLLQEYLRETPAGSPVPWLLLLDLLLRVGNEAGYAEASAECRRHFNVNFSAHPRSQDPDDNRGLENYPHILEMLTQVWNTPEINAVFKDLIYDQRDGVRMGFMPGAYRDILLLSTIAQEKMLQDAA